MHRHARALRTATRDTHAHTQRDVSKRELFAFLSRDDGRARALNPRRFPRVRSSPENVFLLPSISASVAIRALMFQSIMLGRSFRNWISPSLRECPARPKSEGYPAEEERACMCVYARTCRREELFYRGDFKSGVEISRVKHFRM